MILMFGDLSLADSMRQRSEWRNREAPESPTAGVSTWEIATMEHIVTRAHMQIYSYIILYIYSIIYIYIYIGIYKYVYVYI